MIFVVDHIWGKFLLIRILVALITFVKQKNMLCTFKKKAIKIHNKSIHHTPQVLTWKTLKEVKNHGT